MLHTTSTRSCKETGMYDQTITMPWMVSCEEKLVDLLQYWQQGMLSDREMVARWHALKMTEEQRLSQIMDVLSHSQRYEHAPVRQALDR